MTYDPVADTAEPWEWLPTDERPCFDAPVDEGLTDPQPPEDTYWVYETVEPVIVDEEPVAW